MNYISFGQYNNVDNRNRNEYRLIFYSKFAWAEGEPHMLIDLHGNLFIH